MCRASLLRVLPLLLAAVNYACCVPYRDEPARELGEEPLAVKFSCEKEWCGENWQANRILEYNISVEVREKSTVRYNKTILNCRGGQNGGTCEPEGNKMVNESSFETVINRTLSSITELNSDGYIVTDNYEPGNRTSLRNDYSSNQDKIWQIRIPQNCTMKILFEEFQIERTDDCSKDYFAVQITKRQRDIRKYCNALFSITIQRRRRVQLWFHADEAGQEAGIYAQFCFSAIRRRSPDSVFRCDCNQVSTPTIRRRRSRPHVLGTPNMESQKVHSSSQEEGVVGEWSHELMERERVVEEYRVDSAIPRKQLVAQRHRRLLNRSPSHTV